MSETPTPKPLTLAGIPVEQLDAKQRRISMLLWGPPGVGKTTFAATAPGKKLWINFDPDGLNSLGSRPDVIALDLSKQRSDIVQKFKDEDPFGISRFIKDNNIDTVIVDSVTSFAELAIMNSINGAVKAAGATFENPGPSGYGQRNRFSLGLARHMLRVTDAVGCHCIFVAHEDAPSKDKDGNIIAYTILLGGSLVTEIPLKMSEVWHMRDVTGGKKLISVQSSMLYKPMKSRMFLSTVKEFEWKYDADKAQGMTLEAMYETWKANNFDKIPSPVMA